MNSNDDQRMKNEEFMNYRIAIFLAVGAILLSACNFTLAADVTPPLGYASPLPQPTLGPLYPAQPPNLENGAAIFAEDCLPCHGETGLGDGPQGKQLPVPVAALGLPGTALKASPARWYTMVSQGNLDRFMPPFSSLSNQERWDVVAYALSLHTTPEQIQQGRELFESNCADCITDFFTDQETMAALSEDDLAKLIREGNDEVPAFGVNLSDDGLYAVAAYLRTLSFSASSVEPTTGSVPAPPLAAVNETPSAAHTPIEGGTQAEPPEAAAIEGSGAVNGSVENGSGASLPAGLTVTLRGFDHAQDTSGPQETYSDESNVQKDGSYAFDNVELPAGRILLAEVSYEGITYQTEFSVAEIGNDRIELAPLTIYESSRSFEGLAFEQIHVAFDFGAADTLQVFEIYTFVNGTDQAIIIETDGADMPFISLPEGARNVGFEAGQDTNPFLAAQGGFAILPSAETYSLIAFFTLPYDSKRTEIEQAFTAPAASVLIFLPEGVKIQSERLSESGVQQISNTNFQTYTAKDLQAGDVLAYTLTGAPRQAETASFLEMNRALIYGAGALGFALIVLGVWMYLRDRNQSGASDQEDEFVEAQDVMDAIIALDDLHRAGKIPDEAYKRRRSELKIRLKELQ
jgi:mono/diheme cytochrome c family protein